MPRALPALLLVLVLPGCIRYEFDHEIWLKVDGSGSVTISGRPALWAAFKGLPKGDDEAMAGAARALVERSGLRVVQTRLTERDGQSLLSVRAEFDDVARLAGAPAFPDLHVALRREGERLVLDGTWARPRGAAEPPAAAGGGLVAVRFHLPSKVYAHRNAAGGVERGNIVAWREDLRAALDGRPLEFGATIDRRSILGSTVALFAAAIAAALALLAGALVVVVRVGRKPSAPTAS